MFTISALAFLALQLSQACSNPHLDQQIPLQEGEVSPFSPAFNELVSQNLDYWHVPGISIAVVNGDETFSKVCFITYQYICRSS